MNLPVDMVVAVHDPARPIERAVASLLPDGVARVTVVCHGIDVAPIEQRLARAAGSPGVASADAEGQMASATATHGGRRQGRPDGEISGLVRVVRYDDGIRSAAGPFNHGLDLATADYVGVLGSDDVVQPGALAAWVRAAASGTGTGAATGAGPAAVLARLIHAGGELIRTPLARPGRTRRLNPVRDRLAYRTAPLGLLRRADLDHLGLRFTAGMTTGEDVEFGLRLWTCGWRIDYARRAPAYVIGNDATGRTTLAARPVGEELAAVTRVVGQEWLTGLPEATRRAVGIKLVRIHLLGAAYRRPAAGDWGDGDLAALGAAFDAVLGLAPRILDPFPRSERRLIAAVRGATSAGQACAALAAANAAGRADRLRTARLADIFDRESVLRRYANYALTR